VKGGHPNPVDSASNFFILTFVLSQTYIFQCLINHICVRETIVGEVIELVQKVTDIDAAEWIHSGEWQYAGEPKASVSHR
jgi:hypothetical protein